MYIETPIIGLISLIFEGRCVLCVGGGCVIMVACLFTSLYQKLVVPCLTQTTYHFILFLF